MKLKYQMRGLGIGMIVTALLMGVAAGEKIPLSDAEIRARAIELGMVESDSLRLTDLQNVQPSSMPAGTEPSGESTEQEGAEEDAEDGSAPEEDNTEAGDDPGEGDTPGDGTDGGEENHTGTGENDRQGSGTGGDTDVETIVIEPGMDSYSISRMLAEAGLVEDAGSFDKYLYERGASRYIRYGTYEIPAGTDMEEIAKIITGN